MDTMNPIAKLKSKLTMMNRKALVAGAAAVLAITAVSAVTATAYVRNAPVLATASDLANGLFGRSASAQLPFEQNSGSGPIAQAVTPVGPDALPIVAPVQTPDTPPAPVQSAQVITPPADAPVRIAVTPVPAPEPTVTPAAETPSAFVPTAATTRKDVVIRQGQARPTAYRRAPREICN